jgi:hypothetical protein
MTTLQLTPNQASLVIGALKMKTSRKRQSIRNLKRRKDAIIEQVGEKEFNHRIKLREDTINNAEKLMLEMSAKLQPIEVSA